MGFAPPFIVFPIDETKGLKLSQTEKMVYGALQSARFLNETNGRELDAPFLNATLGSIVERSARTVRQSLQKLEELGIIKRSYEGYRSKAGRPSLRRKINLLKFIENPLNWRKFAGQNRRDLKNIYTHPLGVINLNKSRDYLSGGPQTLIRTLVDGRAEAKKEGSGQTRLNPLPPPPTSSVESPTPQRSENQATHEANRESPSVYKSYDNSTKVRSVNAFRPLSLKEIVEHQVKMGRKRHDVIAWGTDRNVALFFSDNEWSRIKELWNAEGLDLDTGLAKYALWHLKSKNGSESRIYAHRNDATSFLAAPLDPFRWTALKIARREKARGMKTRERVRRTFALSKAAQAQKPSSVNEKMAIVKEKGGLENSVNTLRKLDERNLAALESRRKGEETYEQIEAMAKERGIFDDLLKLATETVCKRLARLRLRGGPIFDATVRSEVEKLWGGLND